MVEVLDYAPEDLTPSERLVLVALAEKGRDETREILWAKGENPRGVLRRRTGLSDSGIKKVFAKLAERGLDPRIPLPDLDKHGRPVFAHEGMAARYRFPVLRADLLGDPLVESESRPSGGPSEDAPAGTLASPGGDPLESESRPSRGPLVPPSLRSPDAREQAAARLIADHRDAVTVAEAWAIVDGVVRDRKPANVAAYVAKMPLADLMRYTAVNDRVRSPRDGAELCTHGQLVKVTGAGEHASWACGRCETESPYIGTAVAS